MCAASEPPFDVAKAHRWFAVECNNRAWQLVESKNRSLADTEVMLHAAHASSFHWLKAGSEINQLRAACLLATAYAAAGIAESALRHAARARALGARVGDSQTPFDRACVHGSSAIAFARGRLAAQASRHRDLTRGLLPTLGDDDERDVITRLYLCDDPAE